MSRKSLNRFGSRKSKSPKRFRSKKSLKRSKSPKRFGSSPKRSKSPKRVEESPTFPLSNLPNELVEIIFNKMPNLSDRVALALTNSRMSAVAARTYGNAVHYIKKPSDIDLVIRHRATHVRVLTTCHLLST